jgi:hypothetical protein
LDWEFIHVSSNCENDSDKLLNNLRKMVHLLSTQHLDSSISEENNKKHHQGRCRQCRQLRAGITTDRILEDARKQCREQLSRENLLNRKDVNYLFTKHNIDKKDTWMK